MSYYYALVELLVELEVDELELLDVELVDVLVG